MSNRIDPPSPPTGGANLSVGGDVVIGGDFVSGNKIVNNIQNFFASLDDARERRHQQVLLSKVKAFWIDGLLRQSLPGAEPMELGKAALPSAVERPYPLAAQQGAQPLPADQAPLATFESQGRSLLILGAAGSGKTITLLELARDLIMQAERDPAQPIPVIFPLASWARRRAPLAEWLAEELSSQYQIPKQVGARWLDRDIILPLLDGLDEVRDDAQAAGVAAINAFQAQHGLSGFVVTCRSDEYAGLEQKLKLNGAIVIQPLNSEQVDEWLRRGGERFQGLRTALAGDSALRELAATPLMLNVMSLAFADLPAPAVVNPQPQESARDRVFSLYVQRMLNRPELRTDPRLAGWLQRLARAMLEQRQSVFLIEQLQPSWLPAGRWRWAYVLGSWLVLGLFIAGALGLLMVSGFAVRGVTRVILGAASGLLGAVVASVLNLWLLRRAEGRPTAAPSIAYITFSATLFGVAILLFHWVGEGLVAWARGWPDPIISGAAVGMVRGSVGGLIFGLLLHWLSQRSWVNTIQPVEVLGWRWQTAWHGMLQGARRGAAVGAGLGLIFNIAVTMIMATLPELRQILASARAGGMNAAEITAVLIGAFVIGLCPSLLVFTLVVGGIGAFINGLIGGLRGRGVTLRAQPNEGIRQSARNALMAGGLFALLGSLLATLTFAGYFAVFERAWLQPAYLLDYGTIALTSGWALGLIGALRYGGLAVIQHFTLRVLLAASGQLPLALITPLNEACDRTLLQKVGGGYIFIHRALLEFFASRAQSPTLQSQPT